MAEEASFAPAQGTSKAERVSPRLESGQSARHETVVLQLLPELGWTNEHVPVMQARRHKSGPLPLLQQFNHESVGSGGCG